MSVFFDTYTVDVANQTIIEPVTEDMVKNDLKVEESYDANVATIGYYITVARTMIEDYIHNIVSPRKFVTISTGIVSSVQLKTPVISITSVKVTDYDDVVTVLEDSEYVLIHSLGICKLVNYSDNIKKIEVEYTSGMNNISYSIQQSCLKVIRALYSNTQVDMSSMRELDAYMRFNI